MRIPLIFRKEWARSCEEVGAGVLWSKGREGGVCGVVGETAWPRNGAGEVAEQSTVVDIYSCPETATFSSLTGTR